MVFQNIIVELFLIMNKYLNLSLKKSIIKNKNFAMYTHPCYNDMLFCDDFLNNKCFNDNCMYLNYNLLFLNTEILMALSQKLVKN